MAEYKSSRSYNMSQIGGKDTKPEMAVRRILWHLGYRYRLHSKGLPGKPDVAFKSRKKVIFVHGCYWHRHPGCKYTTTPKSNVEFWNKKFRVNMERDKRVQRELREAGFRYLIVWECEIKNPVLLEKKLVTFLEGA